MNRIFEYSIVLFIPLLLSLASFHSHSDLLERLGTNLSKDLQIKEAELQAFQLSPLQSQLISDIFAQYVHTVAF